MSVTPPDDGPWLVVGLGNPGPEYAGTRHSVGHLVLDELADRVRGRFSRHPRGRADVLSTRLGGPGGAGGPGGSRVVLGRPRSYMNESGGPVVSLRDYYSVAADHVVVVHDELDLPFGSLRCKLGGGDGGHNGLKSIRASLGTGDFLRVRVGIGRPPGRMDAADYVLRPFTSAERKELPLAVGEAADAVESLVTVGLEPTQNAFNR